MCKTTCGARIFQVLSFGKRISLAFTFPFENSSIFNATFLEGIHSPLTKYCIYLGLIPSTLAKKGSVNPESFANSLKVIRHSVSRKLVSFKKINK